MRNVILFHYCKCGACDATVVSIPQFDLLCLNSRFKFVGLEDDGIMLAEVERSDSCPKCREGLIVRWPRTCGIVVHNTKESVQLSPLKKKAVAFVNSRNGAVSLREWEVLNAFVDSVDH